MTCRWMECRWWSVGGIPDLCGFTAVRKFQERRLAALAHHEAGTIKHQFVIASHLIDVDHGAVKALRRTSGGNAA